MALDMVDIAKEIYTAAKRLQKSGDKLFTLAREYAEAEQKYRQVLGIELLKLREQKVPVTLIGDVARANISDLKFNRDMAEYKYKAGRDKAQALQAEISALQTLYKRQEDI
jgi:ABC-type phosphate transport system auxiliary subunit